jgi:macrodomain Ter protein organizer (MatP/YcbG family)
MKAILEFNLDEERQQFEDAVDGWKWKCIVSELDNELRTRTKYASDDTSQEVVDALIKVRDFLRESLNEEGLIL